MLNEMDNLCGNTRDTEICFMLRKMDSETKAIEKKLFWGVDFLKQKMGSRCNPQSSIHTSPSTVFQELLKNCS